MEIYFTVYFTAYHTSPFDRTNHEMKFFSFFCAMEHINLAATPRKSALESTLLLLPDDAVRKKSNHHLLVFLRFFLFFPLYLFFEQISVSPSVPSPAQVSSQQPQRPQSPTSLLPPLALHTRSTSSQLFSILSRR